MMRKGWRRTGSIALTFGVTALFLCLALRNLGWTELRAALLAADWRWLLPICVTPFVDIAIRAVRWRLLLAPMADAPTGLAYRLEAIGLAANNVLVARLGELGRAALAAKKLRLSFLASLSSIVVERLCDMAGVLGLFCAVAACHPELIARPVLAGCFGMLVATLGVLLVLIFAYRHLEPGGIFERRLARWPKAHDMCAKLVMGARALHTPAAFPILGLSLLLWAVDSAPYLFAAKSLGLGVVDYPRAVLVLGWAAAGSAIPAAPGAVGTFEAAVRAGMETMGAPPSQALAIAVMIHVIGYIIVTILGLVFLYREGLSLTGFEKGAEKVSTEVVP
ncbi:MAG: flippase-like domain-containing protein [Elusimicrobia bacterium]|nr:flippase-like domain-containing protein [Elusimicrobiota bacterium]